MRKHFIERNELQETSRDADAAGLSLGEIASVELTSEDTDHPIELALLPNSQSEWRAAGPGRQVIRIRFDEPQQLTRIGLEFNETEINRTQEYVLRWSADNGRSFAEIVRQQFNFSPPSTCREVEEHRGHFREVSVLELIVTPDIGGGTARASLTRIQLQ